MTKPLFAFLTAGIALAGIALAGCARSSDVPKVAEPATRDEPKVVEPKNSVPAQDDVDRAKKDFQKLKQSIEGLVEKTGKAP